MLHLMCWNVFVPVHTQIIAMWRKHTHTIFRWFWLEVVGPNWRLMYRNLLFSKSFSWQSNLINYPPWLFNRVWNHLISKRVFFLGNSWLAFCLVLFFPGWCVLHVPQIKSLICWYFTLYILYIQTPFEEVFDSLNISWEGFWRSQTPYHKVCGGF